MSKALEALERLKAITKFDGGRDYALGDKKEFKIIEKALQRLEAIENANPSEAMECLEEMAKYRIEYNEYLTPIKDISEYSIIKQALLKTQENEDWNTIIKEYDIKPCEVREAFIIYKMMQGAGYKVAHIEKAQEQEKFFDDMLGFNDGSITSCFEYKEKQVVAMPLDEYNELMEQEKVIKIIKEKNVDIRWISENNPSREEYNAYIWTQGYCFDTLDEEEFDLLKRYCNEQDN